LGLGNIQYWSFVFRPAKESELFRVAAIAGESYANRLSRFIAGNFVPVEVDDSDQLLFYALSVSLLFVE